MVSRSSHRWPLGPETASGLSTVTASGVGRCPHCRLDTECHGRPEPSRYLCGGEVAFLEAAAAAPTPHRAGDGRVVTGNGSAPKVAALPLRASAPAACVSAAPATPVTQARVLRTHRPGLGRGLRGDPGTPARHRLPWPRGAPAALPAPGSPPRMPRAGRKLPVVLVLGAFC